MQPAASPTPSRVAERAPLRLTRLAVAAGSAWLVAVWVTHRTVGGDTPWLVDGSDQIVRCLSGGDLVKCGYTGQLSATGQTTTIGPYPLLQYIPDLIARSLGATHHSRYAVLALLSTAAVIAAVAVAARVLVRLGLTTWVWAFLAVVLSGPVLVYASTTWGEMLAAALLLFLAAAALVQAPPVLFGAAVFGACLTKETAYPFVAAIGLVGLVLARRSGGRPIRPQVIAGGAAIVLAFACASVFNILRFGAIQNTNYLRSEFTTPLARIPDSALGLYFAPNGGILVFWTTATALLAALLVLPLRRRRGREIAAALALIVAGLTVSLAAWYSPFGWVAWGPRLSLPWVLALLLLALAAFGNELSEPLRRLLTPAWRFGVVALAVVALTLPHVGFLWRPETKDEFFALSSRNHDCDDLPGTRGYYACLDETMWTRRPIANTALQGLAGPGGTATAIAISVALISCLGLLRRGLLELRDESGTRCRGGRGRR
jgi:hypothetical protein